MDGRMEVKDWMALCAFVYESDHVICGLFVEVVVVMEVECVSSSPVIAVATAEGVVEVVAISPDIGGG